MEPASTAGPLLSGEKLLEELQGGAHAKKPSAAPTMGKLKRCSYTHEAMVELLITRPELDQNEIAAHFGYTASWISNILASDAFQARLAARRDEVIDPRLRATLKERFEALARQSLDALQKRLESDACSDSLLIRAAELGAKATGFSGNNSQEPVAPAGQDRLTQLAERLVALQTSVKERVINGEVTEVSFDPQ